MSAIASAIDLVDKGAVFRRRSRRRHFFNLLLILITLAGFMLAQLAIAFFLSYNELQIPQTIQSSAALVTVYFILAQILAVRIVRWSRHRIREQLFSGWLVLGIFAVLTLLAFRLPYSISFLSFAIPTALLFLLGFSLRLTKQNRRHIGVPKTMLDKWELPLDRNSFVALADATLPAEPVDVIAVSNAELNDTKWTSFLAWCALNAVPVVMIDDYVESQAGRVNLDSFKFNDLFARQSGSTYLFFKRAFDFFASVIALLLLAVPMLVIGVIIRLETPGPAVFRQRRVGHGGSGFTIYKFRSMVTDAEKAGAQFAKKDDLRITSFGRFIRKYRIDEWPQLVNVLRGDMSLIGPRPEQADLVDRLSRDIPLFPFRHSVRPGITGWAQVCQGYAYDVRSSSEKLTYDLYYVKHLSLMLDLMILLRTIKIIVSGFGAR